MDCTEHLMYTQSTHKFGNAIPLKVRDNLRCQHNAIYFTKTQNKNEIKKSLRRKRF